MKHTPKYIHTQDDDDFMSSLDKMMADDLQVSQTVILDLLHDVVYNLYLHVHVM